MNLLTFTTRFLWEYIYFIWAAGWFKVKASKDMSNVLRER